MLSSIILGRTCSYEHEALRVKNLGRGEALKVVGEG
jgi:hypothetical protein